jgi:hypothetical protein
MTEETKQTDFKEEIVETFDALGLKDALLRGKLKKYRKIELELVL